MKRSKLNLLFLVIEVLLLFLTVCAVSILPNRYPIKNVIIIVCILSLLNSFCLLFSYFVNTNKIVPDKKKILDLRIFEDIDFFGNNKKEEDVSKSKSENKLISDRILFSLQLIEISAGYLNVLNSSEKRITAAKIINENVKFIKKQIENEYGANLEELPKEIPFELSTITQETTISENITVAIYGQPYEKNQRLRLIIQSFGFFCYIIPTKEEVLFSIEDNLVQFLIIPLSDKNEDAFVLCKKIREKHSLLDLPILVLVSKYHSYLINQCYEMGINDFIIQPFAIPEFIARIRSLTNYKKLYMENTNLVLSEKEKKVFLYFITHNVNTPLTILLNELHELSEYENQDEKLDSLLLNINEAANQINSVVQNVLNSYKLSDGRLMINQRVLNINEIIEVENIYLQKKSARKNQVFETTFVDDEINVFCDENSLKCIYVNLVDNAIKYTPFGGKIKIRVFNDDINTILQVIDNGKGVPKEKQMQIFNRFSNIGSVPTGKEKSLGLGLYVVNEMCKLNGLQLSYNENTEEESGSIFTVKFAKLSE